MPVVWKYHVRVTESTLSIGYSSGCSSLTVDRSKILTVEALEDVRPLLDWGGWGIRKQLPSWDTGYIPRRGPGVRMEIQGDKGKKYAYTFICMDAEACVTALSNSTSA